MGRLLGGCLPFLLTAELLSCWIELLSCWIELLSCWIELLSCWEELWDPN